MTKLLPQISGIISGCAAGQWRMDVNGGEFDAELSWQLTGLLNSMNVVWLAVLELKGRSIRNTPTIDSPQRQTPV